MDIVSEDVFDKDGRRAPEDERLHKKEINARTGVFVLQSFERSWLGRFDRSRGEWGLIDYLDEFGKRPETLMVIRSLPTLGDPPDFYGPFKKLAALLTRHLYEDIVTTIETAALAQLGSFDRDNFERLEHLTQGHSSVGGCKEPGTAVKYAARPGTGTRAVSSVATTSAELRFCHPSYLVDKGVIAQDIRASYPMLARSANTHVVNSQLLAEDLGSHLLEQKQGCPGLELKPYAQKWLKRRPGYSSSMTTGCVALVDASLVQSKNWGKKPPYKNVIHGLVNWFADLTLHM